MRVGTWTSIACLISGGLSLIAFVAMPFIYSNSSTKFETIRDYLLLIAALVFFLAAYLFNLVFLLAMRAKEKAMTMEETQQDTSSHGLSPRDYSLSPRSEYSDYS